MYKRERGVGGSSRGAPRHDSRGGRVRDVGAELLGGGAATLPLRLRPVSAPSEPGCGRRTGDGAAGRLRAIRRGVRGESSAAVIATTSDRRLDGPHVGDGRDDALVGPRPRLRTRARGIGVRQRALGDCRNCAGRGRSRMMNRPSVVGHGERRAAWRDGHDRCEERRSAHGGGARRAPDRSSSADWRRSIRECRRTHRRLVQNR